MSLQNSIIIIIVIYSMFGKAFGFAKTLTSFSTAEEIRVNGKIEPVWNGVKGITVMNPSEGVKVHIKSLHTSDKIHFLVKYKDSSESRFHKRWKWNDKEKIYEINNEREDTFIFKWGMLDSFNSLSLKKAIPHSADIWFWKADRTDRSGYADDKYQQFTSEKRSNTKEIVTKDGPMYLSRVGDFGKGTYEPTLHFNYEGDIVHNYVSMSPSGSRADVKAKGIWLDNFWTIKFSRSLKTSDKERDVQFNLQSKRKYLFGISVYEIAGRKEDPSLTSPKYGSGDVEQHLQLEFK